MLTQEEDVEIHALRARGWSIAAIARHTGRDPKTVRAWLSRSRRERERASSVLERYRGYLVARFDDDAHVFASVLYIGHPPYGGAVVKGVAFRFLSCRRV